MVNAPSSPFSPGRCLHLAFGCVILNSLTDRATTPSPGISRGASPMSENNNDSQFQETILPQRPSTAKPLPPAPPVTQDKKPHSSETQDRPAPTPTIDAGDFFPATLVGSPTVSPPHDE